MLQPELKLRRDKIRALMALQEIDAAIVTCNVNLIYTCGRVVSGYLYLPLQAPAQLFVKRPNNLTGEFVTPIRKPEQLPDLLKERGLPMPKRLMLEGDELPFREYNRLAACFPDSEVLPDGTGVVPSFGCGTCTGLCADSVGLSFGNDGPAILYRNRASDAFGGLSGHFSCLRA